MSFCFGVVKSLHYFYMGIRFHDDAVCVFIVEVYEPCFRGEHSALCFDGSQNFLFHPSVNRGFRIACDSAHVGAVEKVGFCVPFIFEPQLEIFGRLTVQHRVD